MQPKTDGELVHVVKHGELWYTLSWYGPGKGWTGCDYYSGDRPAGKPSKDEFAAAVESKAHSYSKDRWGFASDDNEDPFGYWVIQVSETPVETDNEWGPVSP